MKYIDATDLIVGRLATRVAKALLLGEEIFIVNSDKAVMTGTKPLVLAKFKQRRERGIPKKGPYFPKRADLILRRIIRGMLPYKQEKGELALKRLRCFVAIPDALVDKKFETIKEAHISNSNSLKYVALETVAMELGAKQ